MEGIERMKKLFLCSLVLGLFLSVMPSKCSAVKGKFTYEEDAKLIRLVTQFGTDNWIGIAKKMGNRNAIQCKGRYKNYLDPNINKSVWTPQEDDLLLNLVSQLGRKWVSMKGHFNNRTDNDIKNRYDVLMRRKTKLENVPVKNEEEFNIILEETEGNTNIEFIKIINLPDESPDLDFWFND